MERRYVPIFLIKDTGQALEENEDASSWRFSHCLPEKQTHRSIANIRLFVCHFLAELHIGQIRVEPERGELSRFTIDIKAVR